MRKSAILGNNVCATQDTLRGAISSVPSSGRSEFMIIDPRSGIAEVALAGHPPPIILRNKKLIDFRIEPGFPLGILPDVQADNVSIHLITGDTIAFYSDGVADATCNMGDFNKARAMLVDAAESPTPAAHLINLLDQRRDHSWLQDDTTAVFLKYKNDAMLE